MWRVEFCDVTCVSDITISSVISQYRQWHHGMVWDVTCDTICDELHGVMSYVISQRSSQFLMLFYPLLTTDDLTILWCHIWGVIPCMWHQEWCNNFRAKSLWYFTPCWPKWYVMSHTHFRYDIWCYDEVHMMLWRNAYDMTKCVWYDEMRFLSYVYDINAEPCNRWIGTRAGGHGPTVPLPPGSWSVGPVAAAGAVNSVSECEVCAQCDSDWNKQVTKQNTGPVAAADAANSGGW